MPGFKICGDGDSGPSATIETRRKHRWIFKTLGTGNNGQMAPNVLLVLQSAERPHFKLDEPDMHHNQEVAYFAGKQTWEPITLTWYDAENPDASKAIYNWFNNIVNFNTVRVQPPSAYKAKASLVMLDGLGDPNKAGIETWELCNTWPRDGNWGEINYTQSEIATIEVTMRFDRAIRK